MDVNKLIKMQYKRHKKIEKIFKCKGAKIRSLKDKIRIEGKDKLVQNRRNLCLSAGCIVTWGNYIGYFRYKEFYNKKSHKLIGRAYVISDENDKQIRIYDDKHGKLEYHDVEYDTDGKPQKRNTVSFNGSSKDIVDDCLRLLTDRESYSGGYLGADKLSIVSKDGDEDEKSKTNSELANSRKKYIATEPTESPEDKILKDCKKRIYILLEFYDRLYSLLGEIFNQRIRRWMPPSKDVGLVYLRLCRFIENMIKILDSDLGYLYQIGMLRPEIDFQGVDDPDINVFYDMKEIKWFPFEHIINVNRDDWENNGKKICGNFLAKITKLWLSFEKEPDEVYKISDSSELELLKSVGNVIKHYRKLDKGKIRSIKDKRKSVIRKRIHLPEKFPTPANTAWNMVKVQFVSKDSVKISAKSTHKRYTFAEMGFKDKRKGDLPDKQWDVLKYLAINKGELSWHEGTAKPKLQKPIQIIRKRLKSFMGIEDDPFFPYKKNKSYKTKFEMENKSYGD